MPYIGKTTDGFGVRNRFVYLASSGATSVSGADANGATLTFTDGAYVDVYLNGVLLKPTTDYNTSTANTIAGLSALNTNDEVTVVVYDVFTVADMVSATSGGTFSGAVTLSGGVTGDLDLNTDSAAIKFGADSDVTVTHDPDDGLILKSNATADDNPFLLTLQTGETDLAANDVIGKIAFQAPDEGTGTDAILVSGAIQARAEGDHSASSNATSLDFMTGASETATTKMSVNSLGQVLIGTTTAAEYTNRLFTIGDTSIASSFAEIRTSTSGTGHVLFSDSSGQNTGNYAGYIAYAHASDSMTFHTGGGTERMKIDSNGAVTKSANPMWWAYNNSNNNVTLSSAGVYEVFPFNTESYDIGGGYNTSNNRYVAPVAGKYYVNSKLLIQGLNSSTVYYVDIIIAVSGSQKLRESIKVNAYARALTISVSGLVHCDASDYIEVQLRLENVSNQAVYAAQTTAYFQGFLVG